MQVIKRDGRVTEFNGERIVKAITLAMAHTPGGIDIDLANKIAQAVERQFCDKLQTTVYEIQDAVEKKLMASSAHLVFSTIKKFAEAPKATSIAVLYFSSISITFPMVLCIPFNLG